MKNQQQQQARELYFQTDLSKTQISEQLGVSRRSVYQWSLAGDWEKLRASSRSMPTLLAEKVYYLFNHFTDHLLQRESFYQSVTKADADILAKLVNTVGKLKKGSTVNESMETFTHFLDGLQTKDAALAESVMPHIDDFITSRAGATISPLNGFTDQGYKPFSEKEIMEKWQDEKDAESLMQEMQDLQQSKEMQQTQHEQKPEDQQTPASPVTAHSQPLQATTVHSAPVTSPSHIPPAPATALSGSAANYQQ